MATYKVPQDVEADDKLIGPFSFRQFVYLIIVVMAMFIAYGLAQIFVGLALIPIPVIIFFGALALPLRKDQPMEIYMAAMVSYLLKPHKRIWDPDGVVSLIKISAPPTVEKNLTKNLSQSEAEERLGYLSEIVDSRGWAVRGAGAQAQNSSLNTDVYFEAQQVQDILDENNNTSDTFEAKLDQSNADRRQKAIEAMHQRVVDPQNTTETSDPIDQEPQGDSSKSTASDIDTEPSYAVESVSDENVKFDPYPSDMRQTVLQPLEKTKQAREATTQVGQPSNNTITPDIIELANNESLSIASIAKEAQRIKGKQDLKDDVVISLR